jgi:hypothetical protein
MHPIASTMLFATVFLAAVVNAEPLDFKQDQPKAQQLILRNDAKLGEMVGRIEGTADEAGKRFFLKGLNVMSPLVIQVLAKDPEEPVDVSLHRFFWTDKDRSGTTNEEGRWGFAGRVHDEVGIWVSAAESSEFYILAWHGAPAPQAFGTGIFVPADSAETGSSWTTTLITVVLALLILAVAYLLIKTRRADAAASLVLIALIASPESNAEADFSTRLSGVEADLLSAIVTYTEMIGNVQGQIDIMDGQVGNLQFDVLEMRNDLAANSDRIDTNAYKVSDLTEQLNELGRQFEELDTTTSRRLNRQAAEDRNLRRMIVDVMSQLEALETLHEADRSAIPDAGHGGVPPMPTSCRDIDSPCGVCFNNANRRLETRLRQFEKLRVLYDGLVYSFIDHVVQYGDARSGWHQLEQARWYEVKLDMAQQRSAMNASYGAKFDEFMVDLNDILIALDECESEHGVIDHWYEAYGHTFYESFRAVYSRP